MRGLRSLRRFAHWSQSRLRPRALVLAYHRIADEGWDPYSLCVSPENFGQQLEVLDSIATPVGLMDIASALPDGAFSKGSVALTFDDGYVDNLHHALPLLRRSGTPATVFVATGFTGRAFWWDELAGRIAETPALPEDIVIEFGSRQFVWRRQAALSEPARRKLLYALAGFMRRLTSTQQDETMRTLDRWLRTPDTGRSEARSMTSDELLTLTKSKQIELGAHTVSHPMLERLSADQQHVEIADSLATLKTVTGTTVRSFAYPNGSYSAATPGLVKALGLSCACAMIEGPVTGSSDPFLIPRLTAPNVGSDPFRRWLRRWLG